MVALAALHWARLWEWGREELRRKKEAADAEGQQILDQVLPRLAPYEKVQLQLVRTTAEGVPMYSVGHLFRDHAAGALKTEGDRLFIRDQVVPAVDRWMTAQAKKPGTGLPTALELETLEAAEKNRR